MIAATTNSRHSFSNDHTLPSTSYPTTTTPQLNPPQANPRRFTRPPMPSISPSIDPSTNALPSSAASTTQDNPHIHNSNQAIGDTLTLPKGSGITRLYFQNINGITVTTPSTWDCMCTDLQYMENDITLFAKHKLDTNQPRVTKRLHDTARKILGLGSYDLLTGTTPVPSRTTFKPGGVLALACGPVQGSIME